ncbi:hypothetical protein ACFVYG_22415 [Streptomyces sp. NPDC058256]|uniref:hypothetical protein n=1 Tax=Streptomyces sp. NPDC058256 TaxID=3346408 RepID=UPI0036EC23B4
MFNSTHDLFLALHASDHLSRLKAVLKGFETIGRDSPFAEGFDFTTCTHPGTCTTCMSGWVNIHPRPGALSATVRRVPADQWKTALGVIGPVRESAAPAAPDPYSLGPLDGVPGWEKLTAFAPGTTVGQLSLTPATSARTDFKYHVDSGHLIATLANTPTAREHCERAWDPGLRFVGALTQR